MPWIKHSNESFPILFYSFCVARSRGISHAYLLPFSTVSSLFLLSSKLQRQMTLSLVKNEASSILQQNEWISRNRAVWFLSKTVSGLNWLFGKYFIWNLHQLKIKVTDIFIRLPWKYAAYFMAYLETNDLNLKWIIYLFGMWFTGFFL